MQLDLREIYRFTGVQTHKETSSLRETYPAVNENSVLVLTWEVSRKTNADWIEVQAALTSDKGDANFTSVSGVEDFTRRLSAAVGQPMSASKPMQEGLLRALVVDIRESFGKDKLGEKVGDWLLEITVDVDTNHPVLKDLPRKTAADEREVISYSMQLEFYGKGSKELKHAVKIPVLIGPATTPEDYDGVVALDFGNTRTTMICLPTSGILITSNPEDEPFQVVRIPLDGNHKEDAIPSAVKARSFNSPLNAPEYPLADYTIGVAATLSAGLEKVSEGLIVGPKRRVADPRVHLPEVMHLNGKRYEYPRYLPAEMYLRRLLQGFISEKRALPRTLFVTYPTTFSLREVDALRRAVYNSQRWAMGQAARLVDDELVNDKLETHVPRPLDEATAAAMYLLYRDDVSAKGGGGTRAFIDKYPRGLYCLIYDCGGGTTDVSLVHAECKCIFDQKTNREYFEFHFGVVGRTGVRRLGGDDITLAAYRVIKAKLAELIASEGGRQDRNEIRHAIPDKSEQWPEYLKRHLEAIDSVVPTTWPTETPGVRNASTLTQKEISIRQSAVFALWEMAENLKIQLATSPTKSEEPDVEANAVPGVMLKSQRMAALWSKWVATFMLGSKKDWVAKIWDPSKKDDTAANKTKQTVFNAAEEISVSRAEIDAQVLPQIVESVEKMNRLLADRLPSDCEVERVYLVGNASRYPLIEQTIRERLNVRFLDSPLRLRKCDSQAKLAVAKGACLRERLRDDHLQLRLISDRDIVKKLPYDVLVSGPGIPHYALYQEGDVTDQLPERALPVPEPAPNEEAPTYMRLFRRWPGETDVSSYLYFDFGEPLKGPLKVRFYKPDQSFEMKDRSGDWVRGVEEIEADYVPYVQSGTI